MKKIRVNQKDGTIDAADADAIDSRLRLRGIPFRVDRQRNIVNSSLLLVEIEEAKKEAT